MVPTTHRVLSYLICDNILAYGVNILRLRLCLPVPPAAHDMCTNVNRAFYQTPSLSHRGRLAYLALFNEGNKMFTYTVL